MVAISDIVTLLVVVSALLSILLAYFLNSRCTRCTFGGGQCCVMERDPLPADQLAEPV